jgi:hypothetical protein
VQEAFGEDNVMFNCSEDVSRLPNTCSVSLMGAGLVGHVVLSECTSIMASVGAACHAQNRPSGSIAIVLNFLLLRFIYCFVMILLSVALRVQSKTFSPHWTLMCSNYHLAVR